MHSQPRMYADDTSITYASNNVEETECCVNTDLDRIRIWLAANKLTLNTTKTKFLLIGSQQRLSTLERNPIIDIKGLFTSRLHHLTCKRDHIKMRDYMDRRAGYPT